MVRPRSNLGSTLKTLNLSLLRFNERSGSENLATRYTKKTLKHIFQILESYSFEIYEVIIPSNSFKHLPEITLILLELMDRVKLQPSFSYQAY